MLIVIEGCDKLGKTMQVNLLERTFSLTKKDYMVVHQPDNRSDPLGSKLRDIINDKENHLPPLATWACHLASHAQQWVHTILPALKENKIVVMDRCYLSAFAYQIAGEGLPEEFIRPAELYVAMHMKPDLLFILYSAYVNPLKQPKDSTPMEQKDFVFRGKVNTAYLKLCQEYKGVLIDVEKYIDRPEVLADYIWGIVQGKIG